MALFLFRFWPVLIPLLVYAAWFYAVGRRATIGGRPVRRFRDGPWYWAVLASLLTAAGCFLFLGASMQNHKGQYVPPHMENGRLAPGHVEP